MFTVAVGVLLRNGVDIAWGKLYADPDQKAEFLGLLIEADWTREGALEPGKTIEFKPKFGIVPEVRLKLRNLAEKALERGDKVACQKMLGMVSHISNVYPSIKPALAEAYRIYMALGDEAPLQWKAEDKEFLGRMVALAERGSDTLKTGVNGPGVMKQHAARVTTDAADNVVVVHGSYHYVATVEDAWEIMVTEIFSKKSEDNIVEAFRSMLPQMKAEGNAGTRMLISQTLRELMAIAMAIIFIPESENLIVYTDSMSTLMAMVHDKAHTNLFGVALMALKEYMAAQKRAVLWRWVPSEDNVADWPSRSGDGNIPKPKVGWVLEKKGFLRHNKLEAIRRKMAGP
jgi:hypothetical protein